MICYSVLFFVAGSIKGDFGKRDLVWFFIGIATTGYTVYLSRQYRHELRMEEAERMLRSTPREEPRQRYGRNRDHRR